MVTSEKQTHTSRHWKHCHWWLNKLTPNRADFLTRPLRAQWSCSPEKPTPVLEWFQHGEIWESPSSFHSCPSCHSSFEHILPGGGHSDSVWHMLCVGSCQDWKPVCQVSPLWEGGEAISSPIMLRGLHIFQMVCMQLQSRLLFFCQVRKTAYVIYLTTGNQKPR